MTKKVFLISIILSILFGCSSKNSDSAAKLAELQNQLSALQTQVNQTIVDLYILRNKNGEAIFTPSDKGYAPLNTIVGNFVVSLKQLIPYANGYKAIFSIGNPNTVVCEGAKVTVRWGKPYAPSQNWFEWEKTLKSQEININKSLLPGMWNKVEVVLSPATAEETGFIGLSLQIDKIMLYQDLRKIRE